MHKGPIFEVPPRLFYRSDLSEIWTQDSWSILPSAETEVSLGDAAVSSGGHSTKHESTTVALRGWKEDLSPSDSRNLALTSQVLLGPGCPQGRPGSPCFINSTLRRVFGHRHQRVWVGPKPRAPPLGRSLCQLSPKIPRTKKKLKNFRKRFVNFLK